MIKKDIILFYGIPAYGHVHSNLYLAKRLSETGFLVIYYSTKTFQQVIEANGCVYRSYPIQPQALDLSDGQKIFRLYRLILQYTREMLPRLLREARQSAPHAVIFESLALWGRSIGEILSLPAFSFYSIAAIDWSTGKGLLPYIRGFWKNSLPYIGEIPQALLIRHQLRRHYNLKNLGLLPALMNKGDYNLMGYSRLFQPDGNGFGKGYLFLGPLATHRKIIETNDFACPDGTLIYVSLGTIFNQDHNLIRELIRQFGLAPKKRRQPLHSRTDDCRIVLVWNERENPPGISFPPNFIVRPFVNQKEILSKASLFITSGGLNSIQEALYYGVPCLLCPQQGEQFLNARQFEKMGLGKILKNPAALRQEAQQAMDLKKHWPKLLQKEMTAVHTDRALHLICHPPKSNTHQQII